MVKTKFKKAVSLMLATVMSLTAFMGIGATTAFAAVGEKADVYLVDYPRSGDTNNNGEWGHGNLNYMNGWKGLSTKYTGLRAMGSYSGNIAYCIEPGTGQRTGDTLTEKDENFFNNISPNGTISGDDIRLLIGRILQYGYRGGISTSWKSQNESDANCIAHAYATQILIWETIVGERDASFNHVSTGGYIKTKDNAKGTIRTIDKAAVATQRMKQAYIATKEKAERSVNANSSSAEEYASDKLESGIDEVFHDGAYAFDKAGRKGLETTKENIRTAKDGIQRFKQQRAEQSLRKQASQNTSSAIKTVDKAEKTIKQSATSSGKKTIKFAGKEATKTAQKSVKTAEQTAKTAIKTSQQAAKAAQKTAKATVKASQKAAQAAKATAKATAATIKAAAKATVAAVKAIIAAVKGLVAAIAAGGWVAVVVIIVLCLVGLIAGSVFGIFFSGEDSGTGMSMQTVVQEINQEYDDRLEQEKNSVSYDVLEMSGSRAVWKEVLAVYSVKVNTDPDNPMEVATVDETKKQLLSDIFWEMNDISSRTESKTHTEIEESDDGHGNIVQTETTVTETFLYITVSHKTVDEMTAMYGFNQEQKEYLAELLKDENNQLWSQVLYGIGYSDDQIVTVALSQVGNVGGQPYWSWYGFDSRVEWCACFVSWCANECGYIDAGIIPKYAGCVNGVQWFRDRGQWADGSYEPSPGTIIFFDWEGDGVTDHTGIVQKCENGTVYTVEGNSGDTCRTKTYTVGSSVIYGYGIPAY